MAPNFKTTTLAHSRLSLLLNNKALLVNMSKLALMFHGKFHFIKAINVRKKNIVQMRPLTAEIKFRATASSWIRKIFCVVIYIRKQLV